jgi:hypothetical protein
MMDAILEDMHRQRLDAVANDPEATTRAIHAGMHAIGPVYAETGDIKRQAVRPLLAPNRRARKLDGARVRLPTMRDKWFEGLMSALVAVLDEHQDMTEMLGTIGGDASARAQSRPSAYMASISAAKFLATTSRLTLSVGVSSPVSIPKGRGRIVNFLTCSTRASFSFTASI